MNKKGFMMAELVVVASIVVVFMAAMYASYAKIYSTYKTRISYYDAVGLYRLAYIRDDLIEACSNDNTTSGLNGYINTTATYKEVTGYTNLVSDETNKVYIIKSGKANLTGTELNSVSGIHQTYKDYIAFLSTNANLSNTNYVMVLERCKTSNINDCKYSYLEVQDGTEG